MAFIVCPGAAGGGSNGRYSSDGITWVASLFPGSAVNWTCPGKINGVFVAVQNNSNIFATSSDGINWTTGTLPASQTSIVGTHSGTKILITSGSSYFSTSDGINWSTGSLPNSSGGIVHYNGSRFVSVSANTTYSSYSTDGVTWYAGGVVPQSSNQRITWNGTVFIVIDSGNGGSSVATSPDGITWTAKTSLPAVTWGVAAKKSTGLVVITYGNPSSTCSYSTDNCVTWSTTPLPTSQLWRDISYDETLNLFCTFAYNSAPITTSSNGINWVSATGVSDGNQNWLITGDRVFGNTFTQTCLAAPTSIASESSSTLHGYINPVSLLSNVTSNASATLVKITPSLFSTSAGTTLAYSPSGTSGWLTKTMPAAYGTRKYNGLYWLGLVWGGTSVGKSTDGITYTQISTGIPNKSWYTLSWSPTLSLWMAASNTGDIVTSPDGVTWTTRTPATAGNTFFKAAWGNGRFVIGVRSSTTFQTSVDGIVWTNVSIPSAIGSVGDVIWTGQAFLVCSQDNNNIARSLDGITWALISSPASSKWNFACNSSGVVIIALDSSVNCLYSNDHGLTWVTKTMPANQRWGVTGVAYDGSKFIMGAYSSSSWATSTDGQTWTSITGVNGSYTGEMRSAWLLSSGTTFNQIASALSSSSLNFSLRGNKVFKALPISLSTRPNWNITASKAAASTTTSVIKKDSFLTKVSTLVNTMSATIANIGLAIRYYSASASSAVIPIIQKSISWTKSASASSTSTLSKAISWTKSASASSTSTLSKAISWTKTATTVSTSNTSKAVLLNKTVLVNALPAHQRVVQIIRISITSAVVSLTKIIAKTFSLNSLTSAYATVLNLITTQYMIGMASAATIPKVIRDIFVRNNANSSSLGSIKKIPAIERSYNTASLPVLSKTAGLFKTTLVGTASLISKAVSVTKDTAYSIILGSSSQVIIGIKSVIAAAVSISSSITAGKFVYISKTLVVNSNSLITKFITTTKSVISSSVSRVFAFVPSNIRSLYSIFVTIFGTNIKDQEVVITESVVNLDIESTPRIELQVI
jgi:hypothetical protein